MSIEWPDQLVQDLIRKKVAVVIGGGVSKNSLSVDGRRRPPLWEELLTAALESVGQNGTRHIKAEINRGQLLHACEWLKKRLDEQWVQFLRGQLIDPAFQAAIIHRSIFRLNQRLYLTPNFDGIFENFVQSETGGQFQVKCYYDADAANFLRDDRQYVLKIHGSMHNPHQLIFTQHDYAEARNKYAAFYEALDACLLSHTFLFIGCGINDPDIALLLENQRFKFPFSRPHYFVTSSKIHPDAVESLRSNRNLKCIRYRDHENHKELSESLESLADVIEPHIL